MKSLRSPDKSKQDDVLAKAFGALKAAFLGVGLFSCAINLLMLTGPMFMLQVYDRVLTSRSVPTLVALFVLVSGLYMFLGAFEFLRARVLSRAGYCLDQRIGPATFRNWVCQGVAGQPDAGRPVQDVTTLRSFLGSPGLIGMFDLPWTPLYLAAVFIIHFYLGLLALGGALLVAVLAFANQAVTRGALTDAIRLEAQENRFSEMSHRNAEAILAMGMLGNVRRQWSQLHGDGAARAQAGGERAEVFAATSKAWRLLLQSAILALGAWLAIRQEISPGMIVAASIIAGRALAPVDQVIGQWSAIGRARQAYRRLATHLGSAQTALAPPIELPEPKGQLQLRNVVKHAPPGAGADRGDKRVILGPLSFDLEPGDGLGVIGPSASGKTTLARLMVGAWLPDAGSLRLDGATLDQWDVDALGRHIGYLPQSVQLIAGTVRQNIARFDPTAEDSDIIRAAQIAGVHEMILRLPEGYGTMVGFGSMPLSGGQVQRVGLARALFRAPRLVVLDEPNANLDAEGDAALTTAIEQTRDTGAAVVVMTHRPSAIAAVNKVMMLSNGAVAEFGNKADVLRKVTRSTVAG